MWKVLGPIASDLIISWYSDRYRNHQLMIQLSTDSCQIFNYNSITGVVIALTKVTHIDNLPEKFATYFRYIPTATLLYVCYIPSGNISFTFEMYKPEPEAGDFPIQ